MLNQENLRLNLEKNMFTLGLGFSCPWRTYLVIPRKACRASRYLGNNRLFSIELLLKGRCAAAYQREMYEGALVLHRLDGS